MMAVAQVKIMIRNEDEIKFFNFIHFSFLSSKTIHALSSIDFLSDLYLNKVITQKKGENCKSV